MSSSASSSPIPSQLSAIADSVREGRRRTAKVRTLLRWFGAHRRRRQVVARIRCALAEVALETYPDFEEEFFDRRVEFRLANRQQGETLEGQKGPADGSEAPVLPDSEEPFDDDADDEAGDSGEPVELKILDDPTYHVSHLMAAHKNVVSVTPDTTLTEATTKMLFNSFDQLPVMTGPRSVKGLVSWKSIGRGAATGKQCETVAECMDPASEIAQDDSLFEAIRIIQNNECVIVRDRTQEVCGILTASDVASQFNEISEPFLLIGEIENLIRNMIATHFTLDDIRTVHREGDKSINDVSDMTFGQYLRLLENHSNWGKMNLSIDRVFFVNKLDEVREARNDVMHFDPEGVEPGKLRVLREFAKFLHHL